jgi:hypothetical protein
VALTADQMAAVRQHAGYGVVGTTMPINADSDVVYVAFGMVVMSLYTRMTTLTATEETRLGTFLTTLDTLWAAIAASGANLDTDQAAVWVHNKNEARDRTRLYKAEARRMCAFLLLPPGPGLGDGTVALVRG